MSSWWRASSTFKNCLGAQWCTIRKQLVCCKTYTQVCWESVPVCDKTTSCCRDIVDHDPISPKADFNYTNSDSSTWFDDSDSSGDSGGGDSSSD